MLGSALYYPHIDIPDPKWLRSAILFWDEIKTIVPRTIDDPYQTEDTKILRKEGFIEPLRCDLHPELLDTLGKRVVGLMDRDYLGQSLGLSGEGTDPNASSLFHAGEAGNNIRSQFRRSHIHPEKLSPELQSILMRAGLARMHPEKISPDLRHLMDDILYIGRDSEYIPENLRHFMRHSGRLMKNDGEWLLVDSRFAAVYMSALAALLAKETDLAALTNEESSMGINLHTLLDDLKPHASTDKKGAVVSFIMEAIRVDPATRVDKLIAFRRSRKNQLAELAAQFDIVSSNISSCETAKDLECKVRDVYVTKIRPKLESLKEELGDNSIQAVWEGVQRAVTISVPASGAMAYFSGLTGTTLLAAGAAIAVTDVAIKTHLAGRKTRRASPYTYLLDVERKFSLPRY